MTQEQWNALVLMAEQGYENTPAKEQQGYWVISSFPILENRPLIIGTNPGGGIGSLPQREFPIPGNEYEESIRGSRYFKANKNFLTNYLGLSLNPLDFNWSNLCPYRTKTSKLLKIEDVNNGFQVFETLFNHINPPWILSTSIDNARYLLYNKKLISNPEVIKTANMKIVISTLWGKPFIAIPHPNAFITSQERRLAWKTVAERIGK